MMNGVPLIVMFEVSTLATGIGWPVGSAVDVTVVVMLFSMTTLETEV